MRRLPTRQSRRRASLRRDRQLPPPRPHLSRPRRALAVRDRRDCCRQTKPKQCRTTSLPTCHNARSITPYGWDALQQRPELPPPVIWLTADANMRMRAGRRSRRAAAASPDKRACAARTATKAGRDRRVVHARCGGHMSRRGSLPRIARRHHATCGARRAAQPRGERGVPCPSSCEAVAPTARRLTRVASRHRAVGCTRCRTHTRGDRRASCPGCCERAVTSGHRRARIVSAGCCVPRRRASYMAATGKRLRVVACCHCRGAATAGHPRRARFRRIGVCKGR
jgi:hypothetical protein